MNKEMGKKLAVLVNPTAGRGRAVVAGRQLREQLVAAGHEIVDVTGANAKAADLKLRTTLREQAIDAIIVVGGDGVTNLGAAAAVEAGVPLAIVPAGTGDDIARGLGIPRRVRTQIALLLRALESAKISTEAVDIARVGSARYFLSVLTGGLDAAVNARANGMRFPRGKARYLVALAAELRNYGSYDYEITIAGETKRHRLILACVANMAYFGGGLKISPASRADDGQLRAVFVHPVPLRTLLWIFPRIFWGGHVRHPAVEVVALDHIRIDWGHGEPPPAPFADGEPIGAQPLDVTVQPGALRIVKLG